jgi:hypothetical protein
MHETNYISDIRGLSISVKDKSSVRITGRLFILVASFSEKRWIGL